MGKSFLCRFDTTESPNCHLFSSLQCFVTPSNHFLAFGNFRPALSLITSSPFLPPTLENWLQKDEGRGSTAEMQERKTSGNSHSPTVEWFDGGSESVSIGMRKDEKFSLLPSSSILNPLTEFSLSLSLTIAGMEIKRASQSFKGIACCVYWWVTFFALVVLCQNLFLLHRWVILLSMVSSQAPIVVRELDVFLNLVLCNLFNQNRMRRRIEEDGEERERREKMRRFSGRREERKMERQLREGEGLETETPLREKLIHTVVAKLFKVLGP